MNRINESLASLGVYPSTSLRVRESDIVSRVKRARVFPFAERSRSVLSALLYLLGAVVLSACGDKKEEAASTRPVRSMVVASGTDSQTASYTAEIRSRFETDLSFQVGGKIVSRSVDVGANVRRGQVLAQLDPSDQQVNADAARSAVNAANAEFERARTEEARYRDLLERGLTTRAAYLSQQTAVKTSQSRLEQANADLKLSQQRLGYTQLRADQDGVVTRVSVETGAVIAMGQRVLSIARPSELEAVFDVPDSHIDEVRGASEAQFVLLSDPKTRYTARVREISPSADPVTRTYQVKTSIPSPPPGLRLGMTVTVMLPHAGTSSSLSLPTTALTQQGHDTAVWIVKRDGTLELRPVSIERYESDRVLISKGLASGERVVTAGVHRLAAGEHVRLMEESQ